MEPNGHTHLVSLLDGKPDVVASEQLGAAVLGKLASKFNHILEHLVREHAESTVDLLVKLFLLAKRCCERFEVHSQQNFLILPRRPMLIFKLTLVMASMGSQRGSTVFILL